MDLIGINTESFDSSPNSYNVKIIDNKLFINSESIDFTTLTNKTTLTIVSDFIKKDTTFTKFTININTITNSILENSHLIHGDIMQNSFVETTREMLIEPVYYNKIKNNFTRIFGNNTLFYRFILNVPFFNLKTIFKTEIETVSEYKDFTRHNSIYLDDLNTLHKSLMQSIFLNMFVVNDKSKAQIILNYGTKNVEHLNHQLVVTISEDFYQGGIDAINNLNYIDKLLLEHNFKDIKIEVPKIEKSAGCCGGGACGKTKEECSAGEKAANEGCCGGGACGKTKEECSSGEKEATDEGCCGGGSCSKTEEEVEPVEVKKSGCCQNKPDTECCKKNKDVACNCGSDSCKSNCKSSNTEESSPEESNKYGFILYMKGSKEEPKCKFSRSAIAKLNAANIEYNTKNILEHQDLRERLKTTHPTFPQLWYKYKFVCGGDKLSEYEEKPEQLTDYLEQFKF
jgi:glutaredoxin-related protein